MVLGKIGSVIYTQELLKTATGEKREIELQSITDLISVLDCLKTLGYKDSILGIYKYGDIFISLESSAYKKIFKSENIFYKTLQDMLFYLCNNKVSIVSEDYPIVNKEEFYIECSDEILSLPQIETDASVYLSSYAMSSEDYIHPILKEILDRTKSTTASELSKTKFKDFLNKFCKDVEFQIIPNVIDYNFNKEDIVTISSKPNNSFITILNKNKSTIIYLRDIDNIYINKSGDYYVLNINYRVNEDIYSFTAKILTNIVNIVNYLI